MTNTNIKDDGSHPTHAILNEISQLSQSIFLDVFPNGHFESVVRESFTPGLTLVLRLFSVKDVTQLQGRRRLNDPMRFVISVRIVNDQIQSKLISGGISKINDLSDIGFIREPDSFKAGKTSSMERYAKIFRTSVESMRCNFLNAYLENALFDSERFDSKYFIEEI